MKKNPVIEKIMASGLSVFEHENNSDFGSGTMHITIIGGVRRVEFYPTTGTVYANAEKGKFPAFRQKKAGIEVAIRLAKSGA
ncbi:TPA: hypothetical protein ACF3O9_004588 [Klebsiella pneumoniae]|uniref:hypothetical protein n=1 Tax=Klebsiella pneumoniae TaxID=573 RepID=UPI000C7D7F46|nr:hypothetical protein [Klebsiella pneumoniae]PLE21208.1 hypothetical protein B6I67_07365 [Klebsiella pneumoniae]HCD4855417.1 hypothetical protein [Klebsiella pneumoniae]